MTTKIPLSAFEFPSTINSVTGRMLSAFYVRKDFRDASLDVDLGLVFVINNQGKRVVFGVNSGAVLTVDPEWKP